MGDPKLLKVVDTLHGCTAIWKDINRLERWVTRKLIKFNRGKFKTLHQASNNPICPHKLEVIWLQSSFSENDLLVLVDTK